LTINISKCDFFQKEIKFLGHKIDENGVHPLPEKIAAIENYAEPQTAKGLRRFLAMINYYRRFLPHAVHDQQHLQRLIKGNKKNDQTTIVWDDESRKAFQTCKDKLASVTFLSHPVPNAPLSLCVDASNDSVGAVIHQFVDGIQQPLAFYSKRLTECQKAYSTYDKELLAAYQSVKYFRPGHKIVVSQGKNGQS
jgi:cleavage and polyadenylation specificity factor subunit 1